MNAEDLIFVTARCNVRALRWEDEVAFYILESDPEVMRYTSGQEGRARDTIDADLRHLINLYDVDDNRFFVWAAEDKMEKSFIGTVAVIFNEKKEYELGYRIIQKYWGRGYATELCEGLIHYTLDEMKLSKITAVTCSANIASVKILDRLMDFVGEEYNPDFDDVDRFYEKTKVNGKLKSLS